MGAGTRILVGAIRRKRLSARAFIPIVMVAILALFPTAAHAGEAPAYAGQWGSFGTPVATWSWQGSPQMYSVATSPGDGSIWILDRAAPCVLHFAADGSFLEKWGSYGELGWPNAIAVGSSGEIFVAENSRIKRFSASGSLLGQWGSFGTEDGQFWWAADLDVSADGSVYVLDAGNSRVKRFSSDGTFLGAWGSPGPADDQFQSPWCMDLAPDGSVYIGESGYGTGSVKHFSDSGDFLGKIGELGSGDGQIDYFSGARGVAADAEGIVYVTDWVNGGRVQRFESDGGSGFAFLGSSQTQQPEVPGAVEVGLDGTLYVAEDARVEIFSTSGERQGELTEEHIGDGQFAGPQALAVGSDGSVYVADTGNNRIQKFDADGAFAGKWGIGGSGEGQLCPNGLALAPDGSVYTIDHSDARIQHFTADGTFISSWGGYGPGDTQFSWAWYLAVAPDGTVYASDGNFVKHFGPDGEFIAKWGGSGSGDGEFQGVGAIGVAPDGKVYVADGNNRIQCFTPDGTFLFHWGQMGVWDSEFQGIGAIAVGSDGTVFVADSFNRRIQHFTAEGTFLDKWGTQGTGDGEFDYPQGVAVGPDGTVYVADTENNRIQYFRYSEASPVLRHEEGSPLLDWEGSWRQGPATGRSGGAWRATSTQHAALNVAFTGTAVRWIASKAPSYGIALVSIDGGAPQPVDLYDAAYRHQQIVFAATDLAPGPHTLRIEYAGDKNGASTGTQIDVDAIDVIGELTQAP